MRQQLESGNAVLQTIQSSEGGRALHLLQQRQKRQQEHEKAKQEIEQETKKRRLHKIDEKYQGSSTEALEEAFKSQTVGLMSAEEFKVRRQEFHDLIEATKRKKAASDPPVLVPKKEKAISTSRLSFKLDDDDSEDGEGARENVKRELMESALGNQLSTKKYFGKDPTVDTSFLSDEQRDELRRQEHEMLIREYKDEQERMKGATIGQLLTECRHKLELEFPELRSVTNENLLYVKEDVILPHHITFHDLIRSKAKGKSGPLFNFDVHDDVRLLSDVRIEKDESHAGKIVERKWYEKNKHVFPASRWEMYNPNKTWDTYSIGGHSDHSKEI